jgi:hypothetical protein
MGGAGDWGGGWEGREMWVDGKWSRGEGVEVGERGGGGEEGGGVDSVLIVI